MHPLTRALLVLALIVGVCLASPGRSAAQIEDNISVYGTENATNYMRPLSEALGAGFSNGLYYSAHIPSKFFIRLEVQASSVQFGDDDKTFQATTEDYYPTATTVTVPTVIGSSEAVTISDPGSGATYSFPGGIDLSALGLAVPQLRIGGIKGTEAIIRWVGYDTNDQDFGKIKLFGLGGRHSISQYMSDPPLDLAVMVNYMSFDLSTDLINTEQWNFGVQGSKRLGVLEPYGGLALDSWSMSIEYTYDDPNGGTSQNKIDYPSETHVHFTAGLALHLSIVHLNAEVDFQQMTSFALGLSIGN